MNSRNAVRSRIRERKISSAQLALLRCVPATSNVREKYIADNLSELGTREKKRQEARKRTERRRRLIIGSVYVTCLVTSSPSSPSPLCASSSRIRLRKVRAAVPARFLFSSSLERNMHPRNYANYTAYRLSYWRRARAASLSLCRASSSSSFVSSSVRPSAPTCSLSRAQRRRDAATKRRSYANRLTVHPRAVSASSSSSSSSHPTFCSST